MSNLTVIRGCVFYTLHMHVKSVFPPGHNLSEFSSEANGTLTPRKIHPKISPYRLHRLVGFVPDIHWGGAGGELAAHVGRVGALLPRAMGEVRATFASSRKFKLNMSNIWSFVFHFVSNFGFFICDILVTAWSPLFRLVQNKSWVRMYDTIVWVC